jgi:leucine dehydrogenase
MGDAKTQKTPELMRKFGEFVHGLRKIYYCRRCVEGNRRYGYRSRCYPYVTGISEERGGAGNHHLLLLTEYTWE